MARWTDWTGACRALAGELGAAGGNAGAATVAVATERDLAGGLEEVPGAQVFEGFSRYDEHDGLLALLRGLFEGRSGRPVTLDAGDGVTATFTLVEQGPIDDLADGGTWYRFAGRLWSGSASAEVALGLTLVRVGDTLAEFGVLVPTATPAEPVPASPA